MKLLMKAYFSGLRLWTNPGFNLIKLLDAYLGA